MFSRQFIRVSNVLRIARLDFVRHGEAASGDVNQLLASGGNSCHEFHLPVVTRIAEVRFAAHFGAFLLDEQGEVEDTHALRSESRWDGGFAPFCRACFWHGRTPGKRICFVALTPGNFYRTDSPLRPIR